MRIDVITIFPGMFGPVLGERVGPWRRAAIGDGSFENLVILRPDAAVFEPEAPTAPPAAVL